MAADEGRVNMTRRRRPTKTELLLRMRAAQVAHHRKPLAADQVRDLSVSHHVNLDVICSGTAEASMLWQFIGGVMCWWKAAQLLQAGVPEMDVQLEVAARLCERWSRTGRVLFDGPDMQLARDGVVYMDQLAQLVDVATACQAADWSQREVERLEAAALQMRAQAEQRKLQEGQAA
jgi:hypothetical protein